MTLVESPKPKLLAIVGPTASGKTSLSIDLAQRLNGEIVSADSRQIYRGMDIGTAKPIDTNGVIHHLIDVRNPDEDYSLAEYQRDAFVAIHDIISRRKLPILVGGTGLYIRAVVENLDIPKIKANPELRKRIEKEIESDGVDAIFKKLVDLDPEAAYIVDPKNPRRIVRALEITIGTGIPFSAQRKKNEPLFDVLTLGITQTDEMLRERINKRIDTMMADGLVDEVKRLIARYGKTPVAFDAIGYREIIDYLDGKYTEAEALALMKSNTWQYARRQMTWFRKDKTITWIGALDEAMELAHKFIQE